MIGRTIFWIVFSFWALALVAGGMKSDDDRCRAKGGHFTAGGFGLCVDKDGAWL